MSSYWLRVDKDAGKFIETVQPDSRERLWLRINNGRDEPRPHGCVKLTGFKPDLWRIRVGDFRVIYQILDSEMLIWIVEVDRRHEGTYKP